MPRPTLDFQQQVKAGAAAISEVEALKAEIDSTLHGLIAEGTAARARAGTELARLQRRIGSCLERCEDHLVPLKCRELRERSRRMGDLMRELNLRAAVAKRRGRR